MWDSGLHPCFTVSHLSGCIFPTRTAEGQRRRKPVQGCQHSPGTSPGCWVFQQEPSLLQPRQAPPPWPSRAPAGGGGPLQSLSPDGWGRGREGLSASHPRTTPTGLSGHGSIAHGGHCFPGQLFAARDIGRQSWRAFEGLRRRRQKPLAFIKHLLGAQTLRRSTCPWQVLEMSLGGWGLRRDPTQGPIRVSQLGADPSSHLSPWAGWKPWSTPGQNTGKERDTETR